MFIKFFNKTFFTHSSLLMCHDENDSQDTGAIHKVKQVAIIA